MTLAQLALTLFLVADAERSSGGTSILPVLAGMAAAEVTVVLILWRIFVWARSDGNDPGPGGGGGSPGADSKPHDRTEPLSWRPPLMRLGSVSLTSIVKN